MLNKTIILIFVLMLCSISTSALSQNNKVKTEDGKEVILLPDGTWKYVRTEESQSLPSPGTPQQRKILIEGKRGTYGIWIDENMWRSSESTFDPEAEFSFVHTEGNAYAMVIAEKAYIPFEQLTKVAVERIKKSALDAKITSEEKRSINGNEVLFIKMEGTVQSVPCVFFCYYYTGEAGTIQLITYVAKDLTDETEPDIFALLDSFEVYIREINLADGSIYKGGIVDGMMHGVGTYTWPNGDKYVGEFIENRASGGWLYTAGGRRGWCYQDEQGAWIVEGR